MECPSNHRHFKINNLVGENFKNGREYNQVGGGPRWSLKMGKRIDYVEVEALIFFFW